MRISSQGFRTALAVMSVLLIGPGVVNSNAAPITWRWDGSVQGSVKTFGPIAPGGFGWTTLYAIPDEHLQAELTFDSNATNLCMAGTTGGTYDVSATIRFGGFQYSGSGYIESSSALGNCTGAGVNEVIARIVLGTSSARLEDDGVSYLLPWMWLAFGLPHPSALGGLPTSIPDGFLSFLHAGSFAGPLLVLDETAPSSLTPVPEPGTLTLLTSGIGFAIVRWRQSRRRRNQETD
jgi:hypothetical protein